MGVGRSASGGEYNLSDPVNSFVDVVRRVVLQPVGVFAGMPRSGPLLNPLLFAVICIEISVLVSALLVLTGVQQNPGFNPNPQNALPSVFTRGAALPSIVLSPILGAIGLFIAAAIQQLLVRLIVGTANSGFGATFRVASYTQVTSPPRSPPRSPAPLPCPPPGGGTPPRIPEAPRRALPTTRPQSQRGRRR